MFGYKFEINFRTKKRFDNLQDAFQVMYSNREAFSFTRQH
jgi:hypothetical protein